MLRTVKRQWGDGACLSHHQAAVPPLGFLGLPGSLANGRQRSAHNINRINSDRLPEGCQQVGCGHRLATRLPAQQPPPPTHASAASAPAAPPPPPVLSAPAASGSYPPPPSYPRRSLAALLGRARRRLPQPQRSPPACTPNYAASAARPRVRLPAPPPAAPRPTCTTDDRCSTALKVGDKGGDRGLAVQFRATDRISSRASSSRPAA